MTLIYVQFSLESLVVLTLIVSFHSQAENLPNEKMVLASQVLTAMRTQRDNVRAYRRFNSMLNQEVNAEIQGEAGTQNMSREEYLSSKASFNLFSLRLKDMHLSNMSQKDMVVALIKTGIRHDLQVAADSSLMGNDTALVFQQSVLNRLGVVLSIDVD